MKRHAALIPLSHDHQHALAQALRLRRASERGEDERVETLRDFLQFTREQLKPHFQEEETLLARVTELCDSQDVADAVQRMLDEHTELTSRIAELAAVSGPPRAELLQE